MKGLRKTIVVIFTICLITLLAFFEKMTTDVAIAIGTVITAYMTGNVISKFSNNKGVE